MEGKKEISVGNEWVRADEKVMRMSIEHDDDGEKCVTV